MADNFDDKNLFGDSFDLFQSDSSSLFGGNNTGTKNANTNANNQVANGGVKANTTAQSAKPAQNVNFGFDDNLFGGDLFGSNNLSNTNNISNSQTLTTANPSQVSKNNQTPSTIDFGFDDNNLFGETTLPKTESAPKQDVPTNLFDTSSDDLFGDNQQSYVVAEQDPQGAQTIVQNEQSTDTFEQESESFDDEAQQQAEELSEDEKVAEDENFENFDANVEAEENADNIENQEAEKQEKNTKKSNKKNKEKIASDLENQGDGQKDIKIKKSKEKAPKPEKTEEQKAKEKKHNKLIIIIAAVALAVIFAIILIVILANRPGEKMKTPELNVYHRDAGTVLVVDKQEGATGYEVVVSQTGKPDTVFSSKDNTIELRLYFNEPGVFDVKVRVLGDSVTTHSEFSDIKQITNYAKLATPQVFRNGDVISWNKVDGATMYKLYYRANIVDNTVDYIELPATESETTFDLTSLNSYGAGLYPVSIEAIAVGEFMLNSDYSTPINYAYCASLDAPMAVVYDDETHTLTFATDAVKSQAEKYLIVASFDSGSIIANHYVYANELSKQNITYQGMQAILYTVNLNEILADEPVHLTIKAVGDGIYSTDSSIVDALTI